MKQSREHLLAAVVRAFSGEAQVVEVEWLGDLDLMVSWPWEHYSQPRKRSNTVHVAIQKEAIEQYRRASQGMRHMAVERLERHLRDRLRSYVPAPPVALNQLPPLVRWTIGTEILLG